MLRLTNYICDSQYYYFMTLINTIDKIVIQCKWTTRVYFWHFLANVSCRILRASGGFAPSTPTMALPWICLGGSKRLPPNPQLQRGHCMLCLQQNIHTSCNLQTTDSGKNISILMRKLREKWMEIIKNSGKTQGK